MAQVSTTPEKIRKQCSKEILRVPTYAEADWGKALKSRPVSLRPIDKRYYFEVLHKEGARRTTSAPWDGPCQTARLERPIPGKRISRVPTYDRTTNLFRVTQKHGRAEVVKVAQSLAQRQRTMTRLMQTMRKALSELADEPLSAYEDSFRETFDLYAEESSERR